MTIAPPPEGLLERLRDTRQFVVTSHANPDGDAIGAELGLARLLRALGKSVTIWNRDPVPTIYCPLPGAERIHVGAKPPLGFPDDYEVALVLECPTLDRTGLEQELVKLPVINIDHHLGNQHYGESNWIDTASPAVGEMVLVLAQALKLSIDPQTAICLYVALASDTGSFRFSNTSARAFRAAATLVDEGADPEQAAGWLYESRSLAMMRLLQGMLETLTVHAQGRLGVVHLTPTMFEQAGAEASDAEGLIDYPRSIAGLVVVALVKELDDGQHKVSLRSSGDAADVERIARTWGGGGHRNAAGFSIDGGSLAEVRQTVVEALVEALEVST